MHSCRRSCDVELVSTHSVQTLVPDAHAIVIGTGWSADYEVYIRVISRFSYVATMQPEESAYRVCTDLWLQIKSAYSVCTLLWLYGGYVRESSEVRCILSMLFLFHERRVITEYSNRYAHPLTKGHVDLYTCLRCDYLGNHCLRGGDYRP